MKFEVTKYTIKDRVVYPIRIKLANKRKSKWYWISDYDANNKSIEVVFGSVLDWFSWEDSAIKKAEHLKTVWKRGELKIRFLQ